nr:unnamed protein product [Callosobruchus chinensis]
MKTLIFLLRIIFLISILLIVILNMCSKKTFIDREKRRPFECGFDPKSSARLSFSLHFFLIAIIFLIFDVEITLLLPIIPRIIISNIYSYLFIINFFLFILLIGLYHE